MCESCGQHGPGSLEKDQWVWAYIQATPQGDSLMALVDSSGQSFVPVFESKETGLINQGRLPVKAGAVELQAMVRNDVLGLARQGDFRVVMINADGQVDQVLTQDA